MSLLPTNFTRLCSSRKYPLWTHVILLVFVGTVVYSNSFSVPFVLDDHYSIQFYGTSKILDLLLHGGSRRVAEITFALNHQIHGLWLTGYHITNLAIHLATAATLYALVHAAIVSLRGTDNVEEPTFVEQFMPLASALLFVCHPLQTQAVTYIIQRYTSLATLFYLFSALAFIKSRYAFEQRQHMRSRWLWGSASLAAALLAMCTKQIASTLPLMLLVIEYILFKGRLLNRRFFIVCGALFMLIPAFLLYEWQLDKLDDFLYDLRHATSDNLYISRTTYFLTQTRVVVTYLRLLILPINQNLFYDYPIYSSLFSVPVLASLALHGLLLTTAFFLLRISRYTTSTTTGICQRLAALGIAWFYIALAVESSIVPIRDVIFEHRVYLPSAGFFMTIAAVAVLSVYHQKARIRTAWILLTVCCLLLGSLTVARNQIWSDSLTLWQDTALKSPNKGIVLANLAAEYLARDMPDKSLPLFVRAIEVNPNLDFRAKTGLGFSLKALNLFQSRFSTGEEFVRSGGTLNGGYLDYGSYSKWEGVINNNMGLAHEYLKEPEKALQRYSAAVTIQPSYDLAWFNMALLTSRLGLKTQAISAINQLKTLNPPMAKILETTIPH